MPAACVSEVLVGSGALAAFCVKAAQHLAKLCAGAPVPVGFFTEAEAEASGTGSGTSSTGAFGVGTGAGAAEGRGGGGSSFLQPPVAKDDTRSPSRTGPNTDEATLDACDISVSSAEAVYRVNLAVSLLLEERAQGRILTHEVVFGRGC